MGVGSPRFKPRSNLLAPLLQRLGVVRVGEGNVKTIRRIGLHGLRGSSNGGRKDTTKHSQG
jgi:hypothetical protein